MPRKISSPEIGPLEDSRVREDQLLDEVLGEVQPIDSRDEGDLQMLGAMTFIPFVHV